MSPTALTAVDGLDLTIERGEIFALPGPNGAGMTTTQRQHDGRGTRRRRRPDREPGQRSERPVGMRALSRSFAPALLAVVLAGCATAAAGQGAVGNEPPSSPPASAGPTTDPVAACPSQTPSHLSGADAGTTEAYICTSEIRSVPGDGVWTFQVARRVTGGLGPLPHAFAAPDTSSDPPNPNVACAAMAYPAVVVYLHGDGRVHAVRAPEGECGFTLQPARDAYAALRTTVVGERRVARVQSQLSVDTQCPDAFKDMLSVEEHDPDSTAGGGAPAPLPDPVSVCTYRIATDPEGERIGHLDGYRTLSGDQVRALNAALAQVRRDPTCSRHEQTRFAVLDMSGGDRILVALDGCAVAQGNRWWRADDQLRQAVGG